MFSSLKVFILPTGIGAPRVKLFKSKIIEYGGEIANTAGAATHIVCMESMDLPRLTQIIKKDAILHGPIIVKSTWLSECLKQSSLLPTQPYELMLSNEIDTNADVPRKVKVSDACDPPSVTSQQPPCSPTQPLVSSKWICSTSSSEKSLNMNKHITDQLEEMVETYQSTKDHWRALGYEKAIKALKSHPTEITSWEEAKALPNIGQRLADKIWEIVQQGKLRKLEQFQSQENVSALNLFNKIWGVGPATAERWVQQGCRSLDDIKSRSDLTKQQEIGLKHFEDFLEKMPRSEAEEIANIVKETALSVQPDLEVIPCGSFRRGRPMCGDVDVLITHKDGTSHENILCRIISLLHKKGFLTDDLATPHEDGAQKKYMGVCKLARNSSKHRRLDIFVVPADEFACALMAYTGSAHFNRSIRLLARKKGMTLSHQCLCADVLRKGEEKLNKGHRLSTPTEESIFEHLGLKYRTPAERDH
uniref:DNA polymerase lambda n=1 Tax=Ornithodoros turicata TaxID=34597 RepID=A0A2R5LF19_9ACAR